MASPLGRASRTSSRPALVRRAGLALLAVLGTLFVTVPAQAAPADSAEAAQLIAARGHELEVVTEQFNDARVALEAQQAGAEAAVATMEQATAELAAAQQSVRGLARTAYTGEGLGSVHALLTSDSADAFVDRMATLQLIAGHQGEILERAAAANVAAAQAQAAAQQAAAEAQSQYDSVMAQQTALQAEVDSYRAAFSQLSAQEQQTAIAGHHGEDRASRSEEREPAAAGAPVVANSNAAQIAIDTAMAQRGDPYVWAAGGPNSFDCSGLTAYAFRAAGIDLPHSSRMQAQMGQPVSRDQLQPGDLVFFYSPVSHVGIYIGDGQMVHAPTFGDVVKVAPLMSGFSGARRIAV
ncbi:cell wall-associated NlpC family hydrolase [Blastococcus colisei]|uniref:Cell wall-associated NlpC family hydrolase n=1 Tax=Blastococcus colisei TaxID=1564162 RepID=A0A543PA90_9ACTN|nr:C40 family peptidase [Blastococcus colisei]TQN41004.1 cell wall-associated NlpC family hydrolase [Blastococcus colisei]